MPMSASFLAIGFLLVAYPCLSPFLPLQLRMLLYPVKAATSLSGVSKMTRAASTSPGPMQETQNPFCFARSISTPLAHRVWDKEGLVVTRHLVSFDDWGGLADGQGGLTLFWNERDGEYAHRFRADGTRRREGESVHMSTATAAQPDAVADAAGGTLIVWREMIPTLGRSVLKSPAARYGWKARLGRGRPSRISASVESNEPSGGL